MSQVRKCDRCGEVFSELEDGWQSFTATVKRRDENGQNKDTTMAMDACPSCAMVPKSEFHTELQAAQDGRELDARIAKLERETGIGGSTAPAGKPA